MNSCNKLTSNHTKTITQNRKKLRENLERSIIYRQLLGHEMNIKIGGVQNVRGTLKFSLKSPIKYNTTSNLLLYENKEFDLNVLPDYVNLIQGLTITGEVFKGNSFVYNVITGSLNAVLKLSDIEESIIESETKTEHEVKMYNLIQQHPGMGDIFCKLYAYGTIYLYDGADNKFEMSACVLEDLGDIDVNKFSPSGGLFGWWSKGFQKLKQLHDLGFCHGDCKTNNIMLHNNRLTWIDPERVIPIISNFSQFTKNVLRLADITEFLYFNNYFLGECGVLSIDDINFARLRKTMISNHIYGKYLIWSNDFAHGAVVDDTTCTIRCKEHFASNAFEADGIKFFSELQTLVSSWTLGIDEFINYLSIESNLIEFFQLLINSHRNPNYIVQTQRPLQLINPALPVQRHNVHSWPSPSQPVLNVVHNVQSDPQIVRHVHIVPGNFIPANGWSYTMTPQPASYPASYPVPAPFPAVRYVPAQPAVRYAQEVTNFVRPASLPPGYTYRPY